MFHVPGPATPGTTVAAVPNPPHRSSDAPAGRSSWPGAAVVRRLLARVEGMTSVSGPAFRQLALANLASTGGDTLVALALADTLFFSVPSTEARANVALYLALTLAPFIVLAPALGAILSRYPVAYRHGLVASGALRAVVAVFTATQVRTLWLYPLAFLLLVLSRLFAISRASLLPVALVHPTSLVAANARLAQLGVLAGALAVPIGVLAGWIAGAWLGLVIAAGVFLYVSVAANELPPPPPGTRPGRRATVRELVRGRRIPRPVRLAQLATAGVRLLNGFLLLLLAFALRTAGAGLLDFGALLGAGGGGFLLAAVVAPWLERRLREEPMVVAALALEAGAAFVASQAFGLVAGAVLAAAAGFAWGTAKFAFDGLLQSSLPANDRGIAFTRSETLFAIAWVIGALIPTGIAMPVRLGLSAAGLVALTAQVVYVSGLLLPQDGPGQAG